ncbi:MAG TPA: MGMT family protein [Puia sp.]|nr:MGMT family protein [Puia sp.]
MGKQPIREKKERLIAVRPSGKREGSAADMIYAVVRQIPRGRVTSYGAIAKLLDLPNARMVGHAMRLVDDKGRPVPAQRVVTSAGRLSHDSHGTRRKLLVKEGVRLHGDRILDFAKIFWDPADEL